MPRLKRNRQKNSAKFRTVAGDICSCQRKYWLGNGREIKEQEKGSLGNSTFPSCLFYAFREMKTCWRNTCEGLNAPRFLHTVKV